MKSFPVSDVEKLEKHGYFDHRKTIHAWDFSVWFHRENNSQS
jgi:hypothetical protein